MRQPAARYTLAVVVVIAGMLWAYPWLDSRRNIDGNVAADLEFAVTSGFDGGPGSLRDAIFRAVRADGPAAIELRTGEVLIRRPLPPLISRYGIEIRSRGERATVDATALRDGPLLDLRGGTFTIRDVELVSAPAEAVRIAGDIRLRGERIGIRGADVGVRATGRFELDIAESEFTGNRLGVELTGAGAARIDGTAFTNQVDASVWIVGSTDRDLGGGSVELTDSRIDGGRHGVVLGNASARLERNEISNFSADGVIALGGEIWIADNQIWNGAGAAIRSVGIESGAVVGNEIHENRSIGIILQSSSSAQVGDNRVFRNGYGIVTVLNGRPAAVGLTGNLVLSQTIDGIVAIGDSPLIRDNRALQNRLAAIRVLHVVSRSGYEVSAPVLIDNVLSGNGMDEPVFAEYRVEPPAGDGVAR